MSRRWTRLVARVTQIGGSIACMIDVAIRLLLAVALVAGAVWLLTPERRADRTEDPVYGGQKK